MSDEDETSSEAFSASEDEWVPTNYKKSDLISDDDDSDFEQVNKGGHKDKKVVNSVSKGNTTKNRKRKGVNSLNSPKIVPTKKRKPAGQSLRLKLYKRYNPPPKTFPGRSRSGSQTTSPSSSTSQKQCKVNSEKTKEEQQRRMFGYLSATSASDSDNSDNDINEDLSDPSYFEMRTDNVKQITSVQQLEPQVHYDFKQFFDNIEQVEKIQKTRNEENSENDAKSATVTAKPENKIVNNLNDINAILALGENIDIDLDSKMDVNINDNNTKKSKTKEPIKNNKQTNSTSNTSKKSKKKLKRNEDEVNQSEESDWEEVTESSKPENANNSLENLQIHIKLTSKRDERLLNKKEQMNQELKRQFNNDVRNHQVLLHKASLLCRFVRCYRYNRILNNTTIMQTVLKILPNKNAYPTSKGTEIKYFISLLNWFKETMLIDCNNFYIKNRKVKWEEYPRILSEQIIARKVVCGQDYVFIFVALIRAMGLHCRLMVNMQPIPLKPDKSRLLPINTNPENETSSTTKSKTESSTRAKEIEKEQNKLKPRSTRKSISKLEETNKKNEKKPEAKVGTRQFKRRKTELLNDDLAQPDETDKKEETKASTSHEKKSRKAFAWEMWAEVWCDVEDQWAYVDIFNAKVDSIEKILNSSSVQAVYVFAFHNDLSYKDVTDRYCQTWTSNVRTWRVDKAWLDKSFSRYIGERTERDRKEDSELRLLQADIPLPKTIHECKNHPLYILRRHLLKFEALYPPSPPILGYVRNEPIYSREFLHCLHSRDIWLKQARVVKLGEKPYNIVKARPKWDRFTETVIKDQPLEVFGYWQTTDYEPPEAENGIIPRNAYGNVDLFKPQMLPKKTVHIRLAGLNRICRKLGIDCANAVIGFDFHQGASHPTFDGFIVCEEFADTVIEAWHQEQEAQEKKETEKYLARVYGNWKKLIRGVLIGERLKLKYKT